jgi:hypothetical protein
MDIWDDLLYKPNKTIKKDKTKSNTNTNTNTTKEIWTETYKPKKESDYIGNKHAITQINDYLTQYAKNELIYYPNLIIRGTNGIGKTCLVNLIADKYKFTIITVNLEKYTTVAKRKTTNTKLKNKTISNLKSKPIYDFYSSLNTSSVAFGITTRKKIIIIDDANNITNTKEKIVLGDLLKINNECKKIPIILITNNKHDKKMSDIFKSVIYPKKDTKRDKHNSCINLTPPTKPEILSAIKKISTAEKIHFNDEEYDDIIDIIYTNIQGDIRKLITILEELKKLYSNDKITEDNIDAYFENSTKKDMDPGIFVAAKHILNEYESIDSVMKWYSMEYTVVPLIVHEQFRGSMHVQHPRTHINDKIDMMYKISKFIAFSDNIDGIINSAQCWNLRHVQGFFACVLPSYYTNSMKHKVNRYVEFKYPTDMSKTSIMKNNNKFIKKIQHIKKLHPISTYDTLNVATLFKALLEKKDIDNVIKIALIYEMTYEQFDSILKIDKFDGKKDKPYLSEDTKKKLELLLSPKEYEIIDLNKKQKTQQNKKQNKRELSKIAASLLK